METGLSPFDVYQKLLDNFLAITGYGIVNIAVLTQSYSFFDDAEIFAVFNTTSDTDSNYLAFTDFIDKLFSGYQVSVYTELEADNLNQNIFDSMLFIN